MKMPDCDSFALHLHQHGHDGSEQMHAADAVGQFHLMRQFRLGFELTGDPEFKGVEREIKINWLK